MQVYWFNSILYMITFWEEGENMSLHDRCFFYISTYKRVTNRNIGRLRWLSACAPLTIFCFIPWVGWITTGHFVFLGVFVVSWSNGVVIFSRSRKTGGFLWIFGHSAHFFSSRFAWTDSKGPLTLAIAVIHLPYVLEDTFFSGYLGVLNTFCK